MTFVAINNKTSPFYQNHRFDSHRPIMDGALYGMLLNCSFSAEKIGGYKASVNEMK